MKPYTEHQVSFKNYHLYAREYRGKGPAIVLLHGFPDNLHLYDYLLPYLKGRHVITFDFLGWGESDKPEKYPYTASNQIAEIEAVVRHFRLDQVTLVAHDASGPPAIDWSMRNQDKIAQLILLNTYYNWMPRLRAPEAITLYSTPVIRNITRWITSTWPTVDKRLFMWQVGRFMRDESARKQMLALLYPAFRISRAGFVSLNNDLLRVVFGRLPNARKLKTFTRPVQIIFGNEDPYLNRGVAKSFHKLFPGSKLSLLPTARHYVQVDEPKKVAELILN